jgi:hypothetical protein
MLVGDAAPAGLSRLECGECCRGRLRAILEAQLAGSIIEGNRPIRYLMNRAHDAFDPGTIGNLKGEVTVQLCSSPLELERRPVEQ